MKCCKTTKNGELVGISKGNSGFLKKNSTTITEQEFNMIHLYSNSLKGQDGITPILGSPSDYMYNP